MKRIVVLMVVFIIAMGGLFYYLYTPQTIDEQLIEEIIRLENIKLDSAIFTDDQKLEIKDYYDEMAQRKFDNPRYESYVGEDGMICIMITVTNLRKNRDLISYAFIDYSNETVNSIRFSEYVWKDLKTRRNE